MPQISQLAATYSSQIFWLLLIFGAVFVFVGRGMAPKVVATVESRDKRIADDLAAAESARRDADAQEAAWRTQANKQRAEAQGLIAAAKVDAAKATEASLSAASARIEATVTAAETRIAAASSAALGEVEAVAAEAAQDIVNRIAGISVTADQARGAVQGAFARG
ncbi:F0F1 ATP synthase subunit B family protein [Novosphingobium lentum]|uniref:F0F1 ATP synthase subunit B family protein n=1 Tax=Novosphingobium lentum TaxID=145287 RepID=UPI0008333E7C|nr:ATPase [Novosphingobium lentum]